MDPATKERFRWKFYRLQVMINLILILFAIGLIVLFLAPEDFRIPAFVILILTSFILALYTLRRYRQTKAWLEEQG